MKTWLRRLSALFASQGFSIVILSFLLLLVFLGTIEQMNVGLYEVQKRYFSSLFLVQWLFGTIPVPLPGVYLLLALGFGNLVWGGIVKAPKSWQRPGLLIAHCGILLLIAAGFVTHHFAQNGHITLYEGEETNAFQSYYDWEVTVSETGPDAKTQLVIPQDDFLRLAGANTRTFYAPDLPFDLELSGFMANSEPRAVAPGTASATGDVVLDAAPRVSDAESNMAGLHAAVIEPGGKRQDAVLWGAARTPWIVDAGGKTYAVDLRHATTELPFSIRLEKFTRELHPRTGIASNFQSEVTEIENGIPRHVVIKMNEPLRYKGYTLFQSSWGPQNAAEGTRLFSVFAVVKNPADQWPLYASCVMALGLLLHFTQSLARYLRAQQRRSA